MFFNARAELQEYLATESAIYHLGGGMYMRGAFREKDVLYKYIWLLRHVEFYNNRKSPVRFLYKILLKRMMYKYALYIPPHTCGKGLSIAHIGPIVSNDRTRIGNNLRIHVGASIAAKKGGVPRVGDNVYVGLGAKVFGDIAIADGVKIGANAVVNKACLVVGATLVGVPASIKGFSHSQ